MTWVTAGVIAQLGVCAACAYTSVLLFRAYARDRDRFLDRDAAYVLVGVGLWVLLEALELAAGTVAFKEVWAKLTFAPILLAAQSWFVYAIEFSGRKKWLNRGFWLTVVGLSSFLLIPLFLPRTEHLYWTVKAAVITWRPLPRQEGPGYWLLIVYCGVFVFWGSALLALELRRSTAVFRSQIRLLTTAAIVPFAMVIVELVADFRPLYPVQASTLAFALAVLVAVRTIDRFRLLDIVYFSRDRILEGMSDAVLVVDGQWRVLDANEASLGLIGRGRKELLGRSLEQVWPQFGAMLEGLGGPDGELGDVSAVVEGREQVYNVLFSPLRDWSGRTVSQVVVLRNVSERKALERVVGRYADELQRRNEELQHFAYAASHDLQEPLRMVASYLELLERRYGGRLGEDAQEFIGYAVDGARRMQGLLNDLLSYSRVGTRGQEFGQVETVGVVQRALENLKVALEDSGARVRVGELPEVWGDEIQLVQVFQNLVANAVKFRREGQAVEVEIGAREREGRWEFWVKDNGIGIEAAYTGRIFQIFQRLHTREEYEGTGVGLAICKRVVERHGGKIWVDSHPGEGSTFYFDLAAREPEPSRTTER